jgi:pseudouridine-5'-phosphate glycosidase
MLARIARPAIAINHGAGGVFRGAEAGGDIRVQKLFTTIAAFVVPFGVKTTLPGTTVQVIEACGLLQLRVAVPEIPVDVRTSGKTAVPPGLTVAVVVPPEGGAIEITTPVPTSGID